MENKPLLVFIILLSLLVIGNIAVIDVLLLKNRITVPSTKITAPSPSPLSTPTQTSEPCDQDCIRLIVKEATSSIKLPSSAPVTKVIQSTSAPTTKEFFIPFGSGSTTAMDWTDAPGLQAYVDTSNYGRIKNTTFEATVHVPNGNQYVNLRLFNATDQHPVWYSDLTFEGKTSTLFLSTNTITLDAGNKLYKVQMKTQLGSEAILDQARLHIITY